MTEDEYRKAYEDGLRKAGELCWEAQRYLAAALIRQYLNTLARGEVDLPVNAFDGGGE